MAHREGERPMLDDAWRDGRGGLRTGTRRLRRRRSTRADREHAHGHNGTTEPQPNSADPSERAAAWRPPGPPCRTEPTAGAGAMAAPRANVRSALQQPSVVGEGR